MSVGAVLRYDTDDDSDVQVQSGSQHIAVSVCLGEIGCCCT